MKATLNVVYLGVFPAATAYLLWTYALNKFRSAVQITTFLYLSPIITTFIEIIWHKQCPEIHSLICDLIILSGVILANTKGVIKNLNS